MAYEFYITIEGTKQGKFKVDSTKEARKDKIVGIGFSYQVDAPRDKATGQASGKRQHHPISVVKKWNGASTQLFHALVTNEVLKTVLFEFVKANSKGEEQIYFTIKLTNATIISYQQNINLGNFSSYQIPELEEVSFSFQKIEIEHKLAKTMAVDDSRFS
jgi:type VI secretion system secreted protein Hcp